MFFNTTSLFKNYPHSYKLNICLTKRTIEKGTEAAFININLKVNSILNHPFRQPEVFRIRSYKNSLLVSMRAMMEYQIINNKIKHKC